VNIVVVFYITSVAFVDFSHKLDKNGFVNEEALKKSHFLNTVCCQRYQSMFSTHLVNEVKYIEAQLISAFKEFVKFGLIEYLLR
jgi:hypothetical protein